MGAHEDFPPVRAPLHIGDVIEKEGLPFLFRQGAKLQPNEGLELGILVDPTVDGDELPLLLQYPYICPQILVIPHTLLLSSGLLIYSTSPSHCPENRPPLHETHTPLE